MTKQIDPIRFFTVFFVQPIVAGILLIIVISLLKRKRNRLSLTASGFYMSLAASFLVNPLFFLVLDDPFMYIFYFTTIFLMFLSPIFLLSFLVLLVKKEDKFSKKTQLLISLVYSLLLFFILLFIPKISIEESNNWRPIWDLPLYVSMILLMVVIEGISGYFLIKVFQSFEVKNLRKRWRNFTIGYCIFSIDTYGFLTYCYSSNLLYRTIWSYISLSLIIAAILMYFTFRYTLKKQL